MFKLDGMRAALLEHIPPLDEATYSRNLGNSQVIDAAGAAQVSASIRYSCGSSCQSVSQSDTVMCTVDRAVVANCI